MAHILLVDDDAVLRRAVGRALRAAGHQVDEGATGRDAMRLLDSCEPDLILTDVNMPEMDGIEVVMALRKSRPRIPIVAMSGGGQLPKELLLMNADALGATATLMKPFDVGELVGTVERALAAPRSENDD